MERLVAFVLQSFFEYLHTLEGADHFWHSSEAIIPREKMQQVKPGTSYIVIKHRFESCQNSQHYTTT